MYAFVCYLLFVVEYLVEMREKQQWRIFNLKNDRVAWKQIAHDLKYRTVTVINNDAIAGKNGNDVLCFFLFLACRITS
jgi:hypothetical protein